MNPHFIVQSHRYEDHAFEAATLEAAIDGAIGLIFLTNSKYALNAKQFWASFAILKNFPDTPSGVKLVKLLEELAE